MVDATILKSIKLPYLSNGLTNCHIIWHSNAFWPAAPSNFYLWFHWFTCNKHNCQIIAIILLTATAVIPLFCARLKIMAFDTSLGRNTSPHLTTSYFQWSYRTATSCVIAQKNWPEMIFKNYEHWAHCQNLKQLLSSQSDTDGSVNDRDIDGLGLFDELERLCNIVYIIFTHKICLQTVNPVSSCASRQVNTSKLQATHKSQKSDSRSNLSLSPWLKSQSLLCALQDVINGRYYPTC